jgi:hypothetical protein
MDRKARDIGANRRQANFSNRLVCVLYDICGWTGWHMPKLYAGLQTISVGIIMFNTLISDAKTFLRNLALNNTRDWFHAHKTTTTANCATPPKRY